MFRYWLIVVAGLAGCSDDVQDPGSNGQDWRKQRLSRMGRDPLTGKICNVEVVEIK